MKIKKSILAVLLLSVLICGCKAKTDNNSSLSSVKSNKGDNMIEENITDGNVYTPVFKKCAASDPVQMNDLSNSYYKLTHDKKLTVAYLGGSVTEGFGASAPENSWAYKTTAWLKQIYDSAEITPVYAGLGGTGSGYGLTRAKRDVLSENPDLIFIEFALNDCYQPYSAEESGFYFENLINEIYSQSKYTDIAVVFITDQGLKGKDNDTIILQREIATHYGINSVNAGTELMKEIDSAGKAWEDFVIDWVHPSDAGYAVYFNAVSQSLKALLKEGNGYTQTKLPKKYMQNVSDNFNTIYVKDMEISENNGFVKRGHGVFGENMQHLISTSANAEFATKFSGKGVLIDAGQGKNCCAQITATVDGKYKRDFTLRVDGSERHTLTLFLGLENGEHTLKITNVSGGNLTIASITEFK